MPNWCEGTLRIRGSKKNVVKFLTEGVNSYQYDREKKEYLPIPKEFLYDVKDLEDGYVSYIPNDVYVEGTTRAFISGQYVIYVGYDVDDESIITTYCPFKQAWGIETGELAELSNKYFLSFKLFAVERGMGFSQTIHIESPGRIVEDSGENYGGHENFVWDCPCPDLGG